MNLHDRRFRALPSWRSRARAAREPVLPSIAMSPKQSAAAIPLEVDDPVWRAAMAAPVDNTPDNEEELAAIDEVRRTGFRSTPGSAVSAELARRARST